MGEINSFPFCLGKYKRGFVEVVDVESLMGSNPSKVKIKPNIIIFGWWRMATIRFMAPLEFFSKLGVKILNVVFLSHLTMMMMRLHSVNHFITIGIIGPIHVAHGTAPTRSEPNTCVGKHLCMGLFGRQAMTICLGQIEFQ